jgi:hypothetical protein
MVKMRSIASFERREAKGKEEFLARGVIECPRGQDENLHTSHIKLNEQVTITEIRQGKSKDMSFWKEEKAMYIDNKKRKSIHSYKRQT